MKQIKLWMSLAVLLLSLSASAQGERPFALEHGPYLQAVGENEATIVWTTTAPAISWVELAVMDDLHFYAMERQKYSGTAMGRYLIDTLHRVTITGLEPGTQYRYRVVSKEITVNGDYVTRYGAHASTSGGYGANPVLSFTTLDSQKPTVALTIINDIHNDTARMRQMISNVKSRGDDMVFFNGDMVSTVRTEETIFEGFMDLAVEEFASEVPMFFMRGNHEVRGRAASRFLDYFPTTTGEPYYTLRQGPIFFVVLDGGEDKPDSDIEYQGMNDFDTFRAEQTQWLEQVVASDEFKSAPYRVVMMHVPPGHSTWFGSMEIDRLFVPILNRSNIDLMLCGHLHEFIYAERGDKGYQFPVLVNSNLEVAHLSADMKQMKLTVADTTGRTLHSWSYTPQKR